MTYNIFAIKSIREMNSLGRNAFHQCNIMSVIMSVYGHFKYYLGKTNVHTVCEPHVLNMDFCSFDNGFKQLCAYFLQEYLTRYE